MRLFRRRRKLLFYLFCVTLSLFLFAVGFKEISNEPKNNRRNRYSYFHRNINKLEHGEYGTGSEFAYNSSTFRQEFTIKTTRKTTESKKVVFDREKEWLRLKIKSKKKSPDFYRINTRLSDKVNARRKLPDARSEECIQAALKYPDDLPGASVVIIFRDEWPSVLIRTIYSLLGNTPPDLLEEIVLVDDGSEDIELLIQIDKHFSKVDKIKLIVNPEPLGLMKARQIGIESAVSKYFVVMDSHIEFSEGWIEPLLARLVEQPYNLLTSNVGGINSETFQVYFKGTAFVFIAYDPLKFSELWSEYNLVYSFIRHKSDKPIPVMSVQGMLIAMKKDFFLRLGGFDPGMRQWGSEQFELSIKTWMCGGRVENVPCSNVAHLYRYINVKGAVVHNAPQFKNLAGLLPPSHYKDIK